MQYTIGSFTRSINEYPIYNQALVLNDAIFPANPLWFQAMNLNALASYSFSTTGIVCGLYTTAQSYSTYSIINVTEGLYKNNYQAFWFQAQSLSISITTLLSFTSDYPNATSYTLYLQYVFNPANCNSITFNNINIALSDTIGTSTTNTTYLLIAYLVYNTTNNSLTVDYTLTQNLYL